MLRSALVFDIGQEGNGPDLWFGVYNVQHDSWRGGGKTVTLALCFLIVVLAHP